MRSFALMMLLFGLLFGGARLTLADDEKPDKDSKDNATRKDDDAQPRLRGQLPANYRKLGLSDEQVQRIYRVQAEHRKKLEALEAQIKAMKAEEKKAIEAVLTAAQKARLKELVADK